MSRLSKINESDLTAAQREVFDAIQGGPRGNMGLVGPFGVYVRAPGVGNATQALGAAVRFNTELAENVKEVAICTVGAFYKAKFEFAAHAVLGRKAGVSDAIIESLRCGEVPQFEKADEAIAYRVAHALLNEHRVDQATYDEAKDLLGEAQMVELVATIGYYTLVSYTLNCFEVPLRDGMTDPFPELPA